MKPEPDFNAFFEKIEDIIFRNGHAIICTGCPAPNSTQFTHLSYTVGLSDDSLPEIVVFGLPQEVAQPVLNAAIARLRAGTLQLNKPVLEICNQPVVFQPVPFAIGDEYLRVASSRAGDPVVCWQLVYPDDRGTFPWEDGFDPAMKPVQPLLSIVH